MENLGTEMYSLMKKLFPICRSITGDGVRKTLKILQEEINLEIHEVPTGTQVFDWTIPKEWNINDAYVKNSLGEKVIDFKKSNLHVLNYSTPINKKMQLEELKKNLHTIPEHPNWIPYLTSYYKENWGFCLSHNKYLQLTEDTYEVVIDSTLNDGHLTYGELFVKGNSQEEILFSCYVCHPSMCNDNLSGVVLLTALAKMIINKSKEGNLRYSYRFLFIPETIGAITWLARNEEKMDLIKAGLVATCAGDPGIVHYKKSRIGEALIDRAVQKVLTDSEKSHKVIDFFPSGSDERQFCSPGFNLPMGSLMRSPYGKYFPEYHTSADNLEFVQAKFLADSQQVYEQVVYTLEHNKTYVNLNPKCEPQLGKRGLYNQLGGQRNKIDHMAIMWVLNMSDGTNSLLEISLKANIKFIEVKLAADALIKCNLLKENVEA